MRINVDEHDRWSQLAELQKPPLPSRGNDGPDWKLLLFGALLLCAGIGGLIELLRR